MTRKRKKANLIVWLIMATLTSACTGLGEDNEYTSVEKSLYGTENNYVGNESCMECHEEATKDWQGSHHDLAMQKASTATVLGDFEDKEVELDGVQYTFYKINEEFHVRVKELDGTVQDHTVSYVFGVEPLQQYMVDFPSGKIQVLRITWDSAEHKWFHQYAGDRIEPDDWLHWSRGGQNWNSMCAECHSTNLQKNYFVAKDSFQTTYSEINVSCESCHGPAEKHLIWANAGNKEGNPWMIKGTMQLEQMNLCAPCHSRRVKLTKNLQPGLPFEDQYMLQTITDDYYHLDGQILEEDYVYGSFLQSKMYAKGIRCSDCHNAHSLELRFQGNKLCLQCHVPDTYNSEKHHFHEMGTEGASCVSCHMTGRYYMGNDFRRDHSFRIPRPDQSMEYDTPNACNECHDDQSAQWAADWIQTWYGNARPDHFSDRLLLAYKDDLSAEERNRLIAFINDLNYPGIARATAIDLIGFQGQEEYQALLTAMKDSSALVRYNALMQFRNLGPQERMSVARKHLTDSTLLVRIGAAQLMVGSEEESLTDGEQMAMDKAKSELEFMLYANADFSSGRLQLADYMMQNGDVRKAIDHYQMALKKDSLLLPVYSNLATAYAMTGQTDRAMETLGTWMVYDEDAGRPYYLRGLLHFELGNSALAVEDLLIAVDKDAQDSRSRYNLATYWYQNKMFDRAEPMIRDALRIEPRNQDFNYLLYLILNEQGKTKEARKLQLMLSKQAATR